MTSLPKVRLIPTGPQWGNHEDRIPRHVIPPGLTFTRLAKESGLSRAAQYVGADRWDPFAMSTFPPSWAPYNVNVANAVRKALGRPPLPTYTRAHVG